MHPTTTRSSENYYPPPPNLQISVRTCASKPVVGCCRNQTSVHSAADSPFYDYFMQASISLASRVAESQQSTEVTSDLISPKLHIYGMSGNAAFADCYGTAVSSEQLMPTWKANTTRATERQRETEGLCRASKTVLRTHARTHAHTHTRDIHSGTVTAGKCYAHSLSFSNPCRLLQHRSRDI
jgi:hypothetical protein